MPPINLLIKPASSACNLACEYCFYHNVSDNREVKSYGTMKKETLEMVVQKALKEAEGSCSFAFQGGEPTLVGLDFYKDLITFQRKYAKPNLTIYNAIQTNGMTINEEWAKFFHRHRFLVGLSVDGIQAIHDRWRVQKDGTGTFERIQHTMTLFDTYKVEYNLLIVVTKQVAEHIREIYTFNQQHNRSYMQFIPCLDDLKDEKGKKEYALTPEYYEKFLKDLFDLWYDDVCKGKFIYVRYFENLIQRLRGDYPEACGMMGTCTRQNVIEADGSVYPCDFYVMDNYCIGNLITDEFSDIEKQREAIQFIEHSQSKPASCTKCKWYKICYGGCRRDRDLFDQGKMGKNYFCRSYKGFFNYAYPRLQEIAKRGMKIR